MDGFELIGDSGSVMLSTNISNLAVRSSGVAPGSNPPASGVGGMLATARSAFDSTSFAWWHFEVPVSGANYGLQLFGPDGPGDGSPGTLLFCAATQTARVVDAFQVGQWGQAARVRNYPAGRSYAVFMSANQFTDVQLRGAGINAEYRILRWNAYGTVNGTQITTGWYQTLITDWTPVPPGGQASFPSPAYDPWVVILDVTGF